MAGVATAAGVDGLLAAARAEGGWGYRSGGSFSSEATALACLAVAAHGVESETVRDGLSALARVQRSDGGVPINASLERPCWPTALAVLAWKAAETASEVGGQWSGSIERGVGWLLSHAGIAVDNDPPLMGHDTSLIGWSWAEGTHSWVEPTAYAVMALRRCGLASHPRVVEGVRLLRDRAIPGGGWNYGNTVVMGHRLRPFPMTTGIALAGLCGMERDEAVEAGIAYLKDCLPRVRSRLSRAWGRIGLAVWGEGDVVGIGHATVGAEAGQQAVGSASEGGLNRISTVTADAVTVLAEAAGLEGVLGCEV